MRVWNFKTVTSDVERCTDSTRPRDSKCIEKPSESLYRRTGSVFPVVAIFIPERWQDSLALLHTLVCTQWMCRYVFEVGAMWCVACLCEGKYVHVMLCISTHAQLTLLICLLTCVSLCICVCIHVRMCVCINVCVSVLSSGGGAKGVRYIIIVIMCSSESGQLCQVTTALPYNLPFMHTNSRACMYIAISLAT